MFGLPLIEQILFFVQLAIIFALTARIWWTKLYSAYPYFFGYLIFLCLSSLVPVFIDMRTNFYVAMYIVNGSISILFCVIVVLELYSVALGRFAGIEQMARFYTNVAMAVAICGSFVLLCVEKTPRHVSGKYAIFEGALTYSLVVFVLLLMALLVYYPIPLNRNVMVYSIGYAGYFLSKAAALFIRNVGNYRNRGFSTVFLAASTVCLLFWLIALRRDEVETVVIARKFDTPRSARLLQQLDDINAWLLRRKRPRRFRGDDSSGPNPLGSQV